MPIKNRDRFPGVDFLPDSEIKPVGDIGGVTLVLLGTEKGTDDPVVSRSYTSDPATEELFATPLSELIAHAQDPITIKGLK